MNATAPTVVPEDRRCGLLYAVPWRRGALADEEDDVIAAIDAAIAAGADLRERNGDGRDGLLLACAFGLAGAATHLIAAGADPASVDGDGNGALATLISMGGSPDVASEAVRRLLSSGAPVDVPAGSATSPLDAAARIGNADITDVLVEHGAAVDRIGHAGMTPLHRAVRASHEAVVRRLLDHGSVVDSVDADGHTALHLACLHAVHDGMFAALLEGGADPRRRTPRGSRPLAMAAADVGVAGMLLDAGADPADIGDPRPLLDDLERRGPHRFHIRIASALVASDAVAGDGVSTACVARCMLAMASAMGADVPPARITTVTNADADAAFVSALLAKCADRPWGMRLIASA